MRHNRTPFKRRADPGTMFRVLGRLAPFTPAEQLNLNLPARLAFESIRTGKGQEGDFHTLASAINVTMIRAKDIDPLVEQTAKDARDALHRCWTRWENTARWGFDGPALQSIPLALDLYEQLLELSTPIQMQAAMNETIRRMQAGIHLGSS